jgi:integrase
MKVDPTPPTATPATLQDVLDRLGGDANRQRDLRSAVTSFARLVGRPPSAIPLDLGPIRHALDGMVAAQAKMSVKRWANLRSDLASAIEASGLVPMLRTKDVELDPAWKRLLDPVTDERISYGLSRFARWASLCGIAPEDVDDTMLDRFVTELEARTLIRNMRDQPRSVATAWNRLVTLAPDRGLRSVPAPSNKPAPTRYPWERLPASFQDDVERHLTWTSVPDPLDEGARAKALAPRTRHLRRDYIHSAVTAALAAGVAPESLTSLASLVATETFKALVRELWKRGGSKLSAYTHGVAGTLIAIAAEWVKAPADAIAALKTLRHKLGTLPNGLTEKNKALLRKFEDPRLVDELLDLPEKIWRRAKQQLATSRRPFIDLQSALAIDLLLHIGLRMENLSTLSFEKHLHWPQGRGRAALIEFGNDETKNEEPLKFEIPPYLADRLWDYRHNVAPKVTGTIPTAVFIAWDGKPRKQGTLSLAIEKTVRKHLGLEMTPHQFRHLLAKFTLDANPGAHEQGRQLLGHKTLKTYTRFYAGIDTRRAARAHADLLTKLREDKPSRRRPKSPRRPESPRRRGD